MAEESNLGSHWRSDYSANRSYCVALLGVPINTKPTRNQYRMINECSQVGYWAPQY